MKYRRLEVECRYRRLEQAGRPVDYKGGEFEDFDLRLFLDETLPQLPIRTDGPCAFEYGTGTGPGACYLAERGFQVDAIDTSSTAIAMARRFAVERGLTVNFEVADIADLGNWNREYDLVVDNFCLHNLISDDERMAALEQVRVLLGSDGYLVVGTSVYHPDREYGEAIRDGTTGVVYSPIMKGAGHFDDVTWIGGRRYLARVRHRAPDELRDELEAAGLHVVKQRGGRVVCARAAKVDRGAGW